MDTTHAYDYINEYLTGLSAVLSGSEDAREGFQAQAPEVVATALMEAYADAELIFAPPAGCECCCGCSCGCSCGCGGDTEAAKRCNSNEDCPQGEICVNGVCRGPHSLALRCRNNDDCPQGEICKNGVCRGPHRSFAAQRCDKNDDCPQGWRCVRGVCVPPPFLLALARVPDGAADQDHAAVPDTSAYLRRITVKLAAGLERHSDRAADVRNLLVWLFASATHSDHPCEDNNDCPQGWRCVNGRCYPVPYVLVPA